MRDLQAVRYAVAVGVGIVRIGAIPVFPEVRDAVSVRVGECVGGIGGVEAVVGFPRVQHAIAVHVGGAEVGEHAPFVGLAGVVVGGADDEVIKAIAVGIAGGGDGTAEVGVGLAASAGPDGGRRESRRGAEIEQGPAVIGGHTIVAGRSHNDVVVSIPIHVARGGHRYAKIGVVLVALGRPCGGGGGPGSRSEIQECGAFVRLIIVVVRGADQHIVVAVAVHIAGRRD